MLIEDVMIRTPLTIGPTATSDAVAVIVDKKYGALPVVQDGKLIGIVTPVDLLRAWQKP